MIEVIAEPIEMISGEILANGHRNGQPHQQPDFYGPFLTAVDIKHPNPTEKNILTQKLQVGDYFLKVREEAPILPGIHGRFILNALMSQVDGGLYAKDMFALGFFAHSSSQNSRKVTMHTSLRKIEESLNAPEHPSILNRTHIGSSIFVAFANEVEIIRVSDDDIREKISVRTPEAKERTNDVKATRSSNGHVSGNGHAHTNGNGHTNGDGELKLKAPALLPQTQSEFIQMRDFEEWAYTGTRAFINGTSDDMPTIETTQDLKRAKNALTSLAGRLKTDLQKERYKLANELIIEFTISEQEAIPFSKPAGRPNGGERTYPIGQEWKADANCLAVNPDLFYPERGASTREAKAACRSCDVREDCLEYALNGGEKFGIWGGASERERRSIRKKRKLAAATAE